MTASKPLKITVLTLFPELIQNYLGDALLAKAIQQKKLDIEIVPLRQFAEGKYKAIDDVPYGGGDGMVFKASVLETALKTLASEKKKIVYLSPQGKPWTHRKAKAMAESEAEIVLLCGRYAGVDQRFIQKHVDEEISIGDYVLSGGELAALVVIESVSRFVAGVLGHEQSAANDSFEDGYLEAPQFTKPQSWDGLTVPEVLASGNHQKIAEWKSSVAKLVTFKKRPDLLTVEKSELQKLRRFYDSLSPGDLQILQIENLPWENL